jgi:membrane dipeptidase
LSDVADHIDHICQLAGNGIHVGLGSDLDGGFGREGSPHDVDTIADLPKLARILERRGYSSGDVAAIMYRNWVTLLRRVWTDSS